MPPRPAFFALALLAGGAQAQALPDPTRPSLLPAPTPGASAPQGEGTLVLQSVLLGARGASGAVISGQLVATGARLGDWRLLRVTESSALLQGPQGSMTLWLIADVDKQAMPAPAARASASHFSQAPKSTTPPRMAESTP